MTEDTPRVPGRPDLEGKDLWTVKRYTSARNALRVYRIMALLTGTFLMILTVEMIYKYLIAEDPSTALVFGGFDLASAIAISHGWCYVVYLVVCFWLWQQMRWKLGTLLVLALAGVVPVMSFILERRIHARTTNELDDAVVVAPRQL